MGMRRWTQAEAVAENARARAHISSSQMDLGYGQFRMDLIHRVMRDNLSPVAVAKILRDASVMFTDKGLAEEAEKLEQHAAWRDTVATLEPERVEDLIEEALARFGAKP